MSAWTGRMCAKKSCNYVYIYIHTNMRISFLYIECECAPQRSKVSWLNTILWPKAEWPSEATCKKKNVVIWMNCLFLDFIQMRFFALFKLFVFVPLKLIMKESLSQTVLFWSWFKKKVCFSRGEIPSTTNVCLGFLGSSLEVRSKWSCDLMTWSLPNPKLLELHLLWSYILYLQGLLSVKVCVFFKHVSQDSIILNQQFQNTLHFEISTWMSIKSCIYLTALKNLDFPLFGCISIGFCSRKVCMCAYSWPSQSSPPLHPQLSGPRNPSRLWWDHRRRNGPISGDFFGEKKWISTSFWMEFFWMNPWTLVFFRR